MYRGKYLTVSKFNRFLEAFSEYRIFNLHPSLEYIPRVLFPQTYNSKFYNAIELNEIIST